ncbi:acyl-CoA dehydrogenase family protein [Nocardia abscessus]|uniref:acyl-CoA dehydrogenase family protein n=1 Tax=Nocardia abscessus TaxID=120957 RepID=UPI002456FF68|nr:acyl-CoA dehydrogenase family protein [Nocardia abscessus]
MPMLSRQVFDQEHEEFRSTVRAFIQHEVGPHLEEWEAAGIIERSMWLAAGKAGLLGLSAPEELGGGGTDDIRFHMIIQEEMARCGHASVAVSFAMQNEVVLPYILQLGNDEQKGRWVPGICAGEIVLAVAITEPGTGSDMAGIRTTYRRTDRGLVLNGSKTFISNGINADLVVVAARDADSDDPRAFTLLAVERGMDGFERGRNLDKVGLHAQDTAELNFTDVVVPPANVLGEEGQGFGYLKRFLVNERVATAAGAVNHAEQYLSWTVDYCRDRKAFGAPLAALQNTRFVLSELATEIQIARVFVDRCVELLMAGSLDESTAAMAKWWCTELRVKVVDRCVQLHGGYGYMLEYAIGRAFIDSRVETIYAGTTEIMKEVVARSVIGPL